MWDGNFSSQEMLWWDGKTCEQKSQQTSAVEWMPCSDFFPGLGFHTGSCL